MATIKSFTSLEQSKKLAEILPLESADMAYYFMRDSGTLVNPSPFVLDGTEVREDGMFTYLNCWSLAALLSVLPESYQLTSNKEGKVQLMLIHHLEKDYYGNPVDACYEIILKLHELNLL